MQVAIAHTRGSRYARRIGERIGRHSGTFEDYCQGRWGIARNYANKLIAAAADELARRGQSVPDAAWAHLTPLLWELVHLVGQHRFLEAVLQGDLRPLRTSPTEEEVEPGEEA